VPPELPTRRLCERIAPTWAVGKLRPAAYACRRVSWSAELVGLASAAGTVNADRVTAERKAVSAPAHRLRFRIVTAIICSPFEPCVEPGEVKKLYYLRC